MQRGQGFGAILGALLLAGCAVSPYQQEVNATCGQALPGSGCFPAGGCGVIALVELPFVGLCEGIYFLQRELAPAPTKSIRDGVYTAPTGSFSVRVPDDRPPVTYKAEQGSLHAISYVSFMPTDLAAPAYTVAVIRGDRESTHSRPTEDAPSDRRGGGVLGVSYSSFGEVERIRDPIPTTLDGQPASLRVYVDDWADAHFLVYTMEREDATLSVSWTGHCPQCKEGSEADILAGVPGAEVFVRSFHLGMQPKAVP